MHTLRISLEQAVNLVERLKEQKASWCEIYGDCEVIWAHDFDGNGFEYDDPLDGESPDGNSIGEE